MTEPNLLKLAKQGNARAIATLMNRQLQPKGITAKAALNEACLQVMLESERVPDRQVLVAFIHKGLTALEPASIKRVKLYGRQVGEDIPAWSQEFELVKPTLKERAKKGDLEAITTLLNRSVEHKNIMAKATLSDGCLQVMLKGDRVPDEKVLTTLIRRELMSLKMESIKTVKLYGQQTGDDFPAWSEEFELAQISSTSHPASSSQTHPDEQVQAGNPLLNSTPILEKIKQALYIFKSNLGLFSLIVITVWFPLHIITKKLPFNSFVESIFWPIGVGAIIHSCYEIKKGRVPKYPEAISTGFRTWGQLLVARFLVGLLILLGLIAFIIPGIYFALQNAFIDSVVVLEKDNVSKAITRSNMLTQGRRWHILGTVFLLGTGLFGIKAILSVIIQVPLINPERIIQLNFGISLCSQL